MRVLLLLAGFTDRRSLKLEVDMSSSGADKDKRPPSPPSSESQPPSRSTREEFKEVFEMILEMSNILRCGLNETEVGYCVSLIEDGADPIRLAELIKQWKAKGQANKEKDENRNGEHSPTN